MAIATKPQGDDTITFDTLKKLLGAPQARHIWAQKQVAEVGVLYDDKALEAALRVTNKLQLPTATDIRLAAPAVVAYWRDANPKSRHLFAEWVHDQLQLPRPQRAEVRAASSPPRLRRPRQNLMKDPELKAEQAAAFAIGMGYCPNHPPGERVKPREEFTPVANGPGGLAWRCRKCGSERAREREAAKKHVRPTATPAIARIRLEAIHKAQEIMVISRRMEREEGLTHAEAVERARHEWEANRSQSNEPSDLPPVPEESERPYEKELEESELVAVANGEEVHQ